MIFLQFLVYLYVDGFGPIIGKLKFLDLGLDSVKIVVYKRFISFSVV